MPKQSLRVLSLSWAIPEHIGGMTSSMLDRSAMLAEAGYDCETVLFAPTQRREHDRERLAAEGRLPAAGALTNLWDILAAADTPKPPARGLRFTDSELGPEAAPWVDGGAVRMRTRWAGDGVTALQTDHYRPDGSLLAIDRRDGPATAGSPGRRVTLFDREGVAVRAWRSIWSLYAFALDAHLGSDHAVLFYDSKVTSRFAPRYRRDGVASVHVIHNRHLGHAQPRPFGVLSATRSEVIRDLEAFERVVCSTSAQRDDLRSLLGGGPAVSVIPPAISGGAATGDELPGRESPIARKRRPAHGVVLSSLEPRKRLDHIVRAVAIARKTHPEISLDVFGTGEGELELRALVSELGLDGVVELRGYAADARQHFVEASWTALSSTHEGFGMAVAEAMADGCVPFAYDIAYGPAELLGGLSGCLAEPEDPGALAARLTDFLGQPEAERDRVRAAVVHEAERFRPEVIAAKWRELLAGLETDLAAGQVTAERREARPLALRVCRRPDAIAIEAEFGLSRSRELPSSVMLGIAAAKPAIEWRRSARVRRLPGTRYRATVTLPAADFPAACDRAGSGGVDIVAVVGGEGQPRTVIADDVRMSPYPATVFGVRGARRWVAALRRRLPGARD